MDAKALEKYSSAVTLSDMEIFVFPDLLYSLVLANIMSPVIWRWREDPWFEKVNQLNPYRRVQRLKQFIIDRYEFNLDLDTWGLTTKERELARFSPWMDEATISRSNALFGYEGDRYYFDLDIRRHFGLDRYEGHVIPYWKTETVEAMNAFRFREGYREGAGECVSLSTLYAAALFVICGLPLEDLFLLATPLHSQNFVILNDGILTNNRRIVTKNMWFNGSVLSTKAQRALRHEQVTLVAHHSGWVHCAYPEAGIDPAAYSRFEKALRAFLQADLTMEILFGFLRQEQAAQTCFQFEVNRHGKPHYLPLEMAFRHEHSSPYRIGDPSQEKLLDEIDDDEFYVEPMENRVLLNQLDGFFKNRKVNPDDPDELDRLMAELDCHCVRARAAIQKLLAFASLDPRLPARHEKKTAPAHPIDLSPGRSRQEAIAHLEALRATHPAADLAFYAYRDLARTDWAPFLKAAMERNPVCAEATRDRSEKEIEARLRAFPNESIYDGTRAAQPDETWNFSRGDGLERALCLAAILRRRHPDLSLALEVKPDVVRLYTDGRGLDPWPSSKGLTGRFEL